MVNTLETGLLEAVKASLKKFSKGKNVAKLLFLLTDGAPSNPWNLIHDEFERINYVRIFTDLSTMNWLNFGPREVVLVSFFIFFNSLQIELIL